MFLLAIIFLIGTLLISIEFFLPGVGIFGIAGAILIFLAIISSLLFFELSLVFFISILVFCILFSYTVYLILKRLNLINNLILKEDLNIYTSSKNNVKIGDKGLTLTDLKNFGTAKFGNLTVEVFSPNSFIEKGCNIKIIKLDGKKIIVEKL